MNPRRTSTVLWLLVLVIIAEIGLLIFTSLDLAQVGLLHVAAASLVTALAFAWDKWRAVRGERRVPEATLLSMGILGGALGGLLAMVSARHKTRRPLFWTVMCVALFAHVTIVGWLFIAR